MAIEEEFIKTGIPIRRKWKIELYNALLYNRGERWGFDVEGSFVMNKQKRRIFINANLWRL